MFPRRRTLAAAECELDRLDERDAARLQAQEELAPGAYGHLVALVAEHDVGSAQAKGANLSMRLLTTIGVGGISDRWVSSQGSS